MYILDFQFKDKYDIRNHLIGHKAHQVFVGAYNELQNHPELTDFELQMLFMMHSLPRFKSSRCFLVMKWIKTYPSSIVP